MIFPQSLPESKSFFKKLSGQSLTLRYLTMLMTGFITHRGRMSAQQAASSIAMDTRHRANLSRFLGKRGHRNRNLRYRLAKQLLDLSAGPGRYVFLLDATDVSQQGQRSENTFSTG